MANLSTKQILDRAVALLEGRPDGMRFAELWKLIREEHPETNLNTVQTQVSILNRERPGEVTKPARGLYQLVKFAESGGLDESEYAEEPVASGNASNAAALTIYEHEFYESFSKWLRDDLDEATYAAPLGGAGMKSKWGTPDVLGVYKASGKQIVKFPSEYLAAEIKVDPSQAIVAFGQAVAYRLFAHKTYIVMPATMPADELARLESLAMLFGVGLVLFELVPTRPSYDVRVRAQRFEPDMFYVNEFAARLSTHHSEMFERIFA